VSEATVRIEVNPFFSATRIPDKIPANGPTYPLIVSGMT